MARSLALRALAGAGAFAASMALGTGLGQRGADRGCWHCLFADVLDAGPGAGPVVVRLPRVALRVGRLRRQQRRRRRRALATATGPARQRARGPAHDRGAGADHPHHRAAGDGQPRRPGGHAAAGHATPGDPAADDRTAGHAASARHADCAPAAAAEQAPSTAARTTPTNPTTAAPPTAATTAATVPPTQAVRIGWPGRGRGPRAARSSTCRGTSCPSLAGRIVRSSARSSTRRPVRSAGVSSRWPGSSSPWRSGSWRPPSTTGRSWCGASRSVATSTSTERRYRARRPPEHRAASSGSGGWTRGPRR